MKTNLVTLADGRKIVHIGFQNRILAARELEELEAYARELAQALAQALPLIDSYRRLSGGDGDLAASLIRHLLKQQSGTDAPTEP